MAKKTSTKKTTKKTSAAVKPAEDEPDVSFLPAWSKKTGISVEELTVRLDEEAAKLVKKHGDKWAQTKIWSKARHRLYGELKHDLKSSATPWAICPLYKSEPFDYGNRRFQAHLDAYGKDPRKAKQNGLVRVDRNSKGNQIVVPIYENELTKNGKPNKRYGKPLPKHAYIMSIGGLGLPLSSFEKGEFEKIRPVVITGSGEENSVADPNLRDPELSQKLRKHFLGDGFNLGQWYKTKATNRTDKDDDEQYELNATTVTRWTELLDGEEPLVVDPSKIEDYFSDFMVPLGELQDYHDNFKEISDDGKKEKCNRLVVTQGLVVDIAPSDSDNSHRMSIDDESLGFGDENEEGIVDSVTCWVDNRYVFEFGRQSTIMVFGTTGAMLKKDMATNELTDEFGPPSIGVQGIVVLELVEPEDLEDDEGGTVEEAEAEGTVEIEEPNIATVNDEDEEEEEEGSDDGEGDEKW